MNSQHESLWNWGVNKTSSLAAASSGALRFRCVHFSPLSSFITAWGQSHLSPKRNPITSNKIRPWEAETSSFSRSVCMCVFPSLMKKMKKYEKAAVRYVSRKANCVREGPNLFSSLSPLLPVHNFCFSPGSFIPFWNIFSKPGRKIPPLWIIQQLLNVFSCYSQKTDSKLIQIHVCSSVNSFGEKSDTGNKSKD